jgi:hypothetical protein
MAASTRKSVREGPLSCGAALLDPGSATSAAGNVAEIEVSLIRKSSFSVTFSCRGRSEDTKINFRKPLGIFDYGDYVIEVDAMIAPRI